MAQLHDGDLAAKAQPNNSGLKWDWFVMPLKKKCPPLSFAQTIRRS